jgi:hypothetical protein
LKAGVKDEIRKLRQMPPPILISECAIRLCEDRRRAPVGGRQPSADCGCRFRLEKHPEQSKPVSVPPWGGGGRARRDKIFGGRARLSGRLRGVACPGVAHVRTTDRETAWGLIRPIGKGCTREAFPSPRCRRVLLPAAASHRRGFLISDDRRAAKVTTSIFSLFARTHISAETPDSIAFVHLYPSICHARDNGAAGPDSLFGGLSACLEPRESSSRG